MPDGPHAKSPTFFVAPDAATIHCGDRRHLPTMPGRIVWLVLGLLLAGPCPGHAVPGDVLVPEGEPVALLQHAVPLPLAAVHAVAFSPDRETVATGDVSGLVRLWNVRNGRELRRLRGAAGPVRALRFSPDGRVLAAAGDDGLVHLFAPADGRELRRLTGHEAAVLALDFTRDGAMLASASVDRTARLWQVSSGRELRRLTGHNAAVTAVAFATEDALLASGSDDHSIRVWEVATGRALKQMTEHSGAISGLAASPREPVLASSSHDRSIRLWELPSGRQRLRIDGHEQAVTCLVFSPDGFVLASGAADHTARVWDATSGRELSRFARHTQPIMALAASPDGRVIASGGLDGTLRLWEIASAFEVLRLGQHTRINQLRFSPDGRLIAAADDDRAVTLWDADSGRLVQAHALHRAPVTAVAFDPSGHLVASGGRDEDIYLWDVAHRQPLGVLSGHRGEITALAFSPVEQRIASSSTDGTVRLWELHERRELRQLTGHTGSVRSIAFTRDGRTLASLGADRTVVLWNVATGQAGQRLAEHFALTSPDASLGQAAADGDLLVAAAQGHDVRLGRIDGSTGGYAPDLLLAATEELAGPLAWSAAQGFLAASGSGGNVWLWRLGDGHAIGHLAGHRIPITALATTTGEGNHLLASAAADDTLRIWSVDRLQPRAVIHYGQGLRWAAQSHAAPALLYRADDGRLLTVERDDGGIAAALPPRPAADSRAPSLSVSIDPEQVRAPGEGSGEPGHILLHVSNRADAGRAYWLAVEVLGPSKSLLTVPPPVVERLDPGAAADLVVHLFALTGTGPNAQSDPTTDVPRPREARLTLTLRDGFGRVHAAVPVMLHLRAPQLELRPPSIHAYWRGGAVDVSVANRGNQDTGMLRVSVVFRRNERVVAESAAQQISHLPPGATAHLSMLVSDTLCDGHDFDVEVRASGAIWPSHQWRFSPVSLRVGLPFGFYLLMLLLLTTSAIGVAFIRLYRDPIVLHVARSPTTLRGFELGELALVTRALRRIGRLKDALVAANISTARWNNAVAAAQGEPIDVARAFARALRASLGKPLEASMENAWEIDLPPLGLRFDSKTTLLVCRGEMLQGGSARRLGATIQAQVSHRKVAIAIDLTARQNAHEVLAEVPHISFVTLGTSDLRDLLLGEQPTAVLETIISNQRPLVELSHYRHQGPVDHDLMFFGRQRELQLILAREHRLIALVGPPHIGKSSLLRAVARRLRTRDDIDVHLLSVEHSDLSALMARALSTIPPADSPQSLLRLGAGTGNRPVLWLLDEADAFLAADAAAGYPCAMMIGQLSAQGHASFVMAGHWETYHAVAHDSRSPLYRAGHVLRLGPLDPSAAYEFATVPMKALGLSYDATTTVERIRDATACHPSLISLACSRLIDTLAANSHVIDRDHVEGMLNRWRGSAVLDLLSYWRAVPLDRAVLIATLLLYKANATDLSQRLTLAGYPPSPDDLALSIERLRLGQLLAIDEEERLYLTIPLLRLAFGSTSEVEKLLDQCIAALRRFRM